MIEALTGPNQQVGLVASGQIGAAAVNASGGINGHRVQIDFCDDQSTSQGAALCAQQLLVQDKDLLLIGSDGVEAPGYLPVVEANHTFSWGDSGAAPQALTSPLVYMFTPNLSSFWVLPKQLSPTTKKVMFLLLDYPAAIQSYQQGAKYLAPGTAYDKVVVPPTATTFDSYCLQIKQYNADAVIPEMSPGVLAPLMVTCHNYDIHATWALSSIIVNQAIVDEVAKYNLPNVVNMSFGGGISKFGADIAKYASQVSQTGANTLQDGDYSAWLAAKTLPSLIKGAKSMDPQVIKAWLDQQTAFDMLGVIPPIDWTKSPDPQLRALKNLSGYPARIDSSGKVVLTSQTPTTATVLP